jgi:hypothetical protein
MRNLKSAFITSLLSVLAVSPLVFAAPLSSARNDSQEFKDAVHALKMDDRAKAYRLFTELWAKAPSFDIAVLLGQTELFLEKYRDAAEHLSLAVRDFPPSEPPKKLEGIKTALEKARAKVGAVKVTVEAIGTEVTIDGKSIGQTPFDIETYVEPGSHVVKAAHPAFGTAEQTIISKAGEQQAVDLKLVKVGNTDQPGKLPYDSTALDDPRSTKVTEPPKMEPRSGIETKTIVLVVGGVVTVAAGVTATVFTLKGKSANSDAKDLEAQAVTEYGDKACPGSSASATALCSKLVGKLSDRNDANNIANWSFAITGVAATATIATWLFWPNKKPAASAWHLVPVVGQNASGLVVDGSF